MSKVAIARSSEKNAQAKPYLVKPANAGQLARAYNISRDTIWAIKRDIESSLKQQRGHAKASR